MCPYMSDVTIRILYVHTWATCPYMPVSDHTQMLVPIQITCDHTRYVGSIPVLFCVNQGQCPYQRLVKMGCCRQRMLMYTNPFALLKIVHLKGSQY